MIWGAYLALALALIWAGSDGSAVALQTVGPAVRQAVRAAAVTFGLLIALAAVAFVFNLAGEPAHAVSDDPIAYLLFASLGIGGLIHAAGAAAWRGAVAQLMRAVGWTLIVLPMTFPSTLTLGLVLAAPLVVTVVTRIPDRSGDPDAPPLSTGRRPWRARR